MKIPRDLYYILNQSRLPFGGYAEESFVSTPWCRERSAEEKIDRLVEKDLPFDLVRPESFQHFNLPRNHRESAIRFAAPAGCRGRGGTDPWDAIEFKPFAYHAGDEQPLRIHEARKRKEEGGDLDFMHTPIGRVDLPFGANLHTLTECDFDSVVGQVKKPVSLTWKTWDRSSRMTFTVEGPGVTFGANRAKKVEFLQECMAAVRITDPGPWGSKREAVQSISRLLDHRRFVASESDEDLFWLVLNPMAYIYDGPGPKKETTATVLHIPSEANDSEDDEQTVEIRVMAAHEGDRKPIPVARAKALESTELMQVPLGFIGWAPTERRQGNFEQPANWTWTGDWEEPSGWAWADGWEEPIELTWRNISGFNESGYTRSLAQKYIFLRHYLKMVYIVDAGEEIDEEAVVRTLEELAGIELRHSTNSLGQDYWWKVQYGGPTLGGRDSYTKSSSQPPGHNSNSGAPSVLDLYGGDEQRAHDHYWNTN